jgi:hypothetical protein
MHQSLRRHSNRRFKFQGNSLYPLKSIDIIPTRKGGCHIALTASVSSKGELGLLFDMLDKLFSRGKHGSPE